MGATIVQEPVDQITYWHVELPRHDILFAESLACESYLGTGNRDAFENGGIATQLYPDFAMRVWESSACAKLVLEGAEVTAARSFLLERAEMLGHSLTRDPNLALRIDGCMLLPAVRDRTFQFRLPRNAKSIRLVSRRSVPAYVCDDSNDCRRLGVAVSKIRLDDIPIALADTRLGAGWYDIESAEGTTDWRWTEARTPAASCFAVATAPNTGPYCPQNG